MTFINRNLSNPIYNKKYVDNKLSKMRFKDFSVLSYSYAEIGFETTFLF